ncbi:hypothetical protein HNQ85_000651 [Anoxybacillus calidus]|uniref:Subunit I/II of b(O/a)3-type cytochrome C oxidase n=1 Tax=[Anoxybacillus] calidus TaxID=575178 RepID=A0A7V9YXR9_9BACL|nr:cytochrome c oxidase subunit 2A [Anoxybacillus calidus]MBA2870393.1 hypothetical protein [Anoxybacillus calidus]
MAIPQLQNTKPKVKMTKESPSLKGTLASVFLLGFFLMFTWISIYFLFLDRL